MQQWRIGQLVKQWEQGIITTIEAIGRLLGELTDDAYDDFCKQIPIELMDVLKKRVDELPTTQEEWDKMRVFQMVSVCGGTLEDIIKAKEERDKLYIKNMRRGVEVFRDRQQGGNNDNVSRFGKIQS